MHRAHMSSHERALRSRLAKVVHDEPLVRGTLSRRRITCGKPGCRCAKGQTHDAVYLSCSKKGSPRQMFVPREREKEVRCWVENYHELKGLLEELSDLFWGRVKSEEKQPFSHDS